MILKRVVTVAVAAVVILFSVAFYCTLWGMNSMDLMLNIDKTEDGFEWNGRSYGAKMRVDDGAFDSLLFYRRESTLRILEY